MDIFVKAVNHNNYDTRECDGGAVSQAYSRGMFLWTRQNDSEALSHTKILCNLCLLFPVRQGDKGTVPRTSDLSILRLFLQIRGCSSGTVQQTTVLCTLLIMSLQVRWYNNWTDLQAIVLCNLRLSDTRVRQRVISTDHVVLSNLRLIFQILRIR